MRPVLIKNTYFNRITVTILIIIFIFFLILLSSYAKNYNDDSQQGFVSVADGRGGEMLVPLYKNIPVSNFAPEDFYPDGAYIGYSGKAYNAKRGIDVSVHQGEIDWIAVRKDGVEFVMIRAGYRGYSKGELHEDTYFRKNIEGALSAGLEVGVYFFSQATNTDEAAEEARFLLNIIKDYDLSLPVFYDWELVAGVGETRVDGIKGSTITDCCLTFCSIIANEGYDTGVYLYRSLGYFDYELDRLSDLIFWVGAPGGVPDFYYKHKIWQYSFTGTVNGIEGDVDLNIMFEE